MGNKIRSVSLTMTEDDFLTDYQLSPTLLLREKIWEYKGALKKLAEKQLQKQGYIIKEQSDFIIELQDVLAEKGIEAPAFRGI